MVHNHSHSVRNIFMDRFSGHFHNLEPAEVYASYLLDSDIVNRDTLVVCAPDKGAVGFVKDVKDAFMPVDIPLLVMTKERHGEREVELGVARDSPIPASDLEGRDVAVIDDMTRTGSTIVECCRILKELGARRVVIMVTHFYSSREIRVRLNEDIVDEIVTTNTIPQILNRDSQGRLRKKMVVLKIERWVGSYVLTLLGSERSPMEPLYAEDMSSKNPRWRGKMGPLFSNDE
jgi:ribose-phosphate pyrophosphokinase